MDEIYAVLICALVGLVIGGLIGHFYCDGISPACWWGALVGLALPFGIEAGTDFFGSCH